MASVTITAAGICAGGNHLHLTVTGAKTASVRLDLEDMAAPITDDDLASFVRVLCRLCKSGKTPAQAKAALQAGVTVTA